MKKLLLALLGVLVALPTLARDFKYTYEGQTLTYTVIDENAKTCKTKDGDEGWEGNSVSRELVIPEIAKDGDTEYSVTSLGNYAFFRCKGLTQVTIPNSVTSIGSNAFIYCSGLTQVIIPNSVTSIGNDAFYGCPGLKKSAFPNTIKNPFSNGVAIAYNPDGAVIEDYWIYSPDKSEIRFAPYTLEGEYEIPETVTSIDFGAFAYCNGLTQVTIPNSVTSIGNDAFEHCSSLTQVTIPNSVTSIGDYAFFECNGLKQVTIPNSVTSINYGTFAYCGGLEQVTIPNSVTSIDYGAFAYCSGLEQVTIPKSVTSIGDYAFAGCSGLKKSAYPNTLSNPFSDGIAIAYNPDGDVIEDNWIYSPDKSEIRFAPLTLEGECTIPETVTSIGDYAFYFCYGMTQVIIPNSVTSIGDDAFSKCRGLKKSAYPNYFNDNPFSNGIAVAYNPDGAVIEDNWIYGPDKSEIRFAPYTLEGVYTIPETVTSIGDYAFYGCNGLTQVKVLSDLPPQMFSSAFNGLYDTVKLEVPAGAVYNYMLTAWAYFKNIYREGSDETLAATYKYNDGVLNYMLMPAADGYERNIAVVMPGDYSGDITIPERFAYTNPQGETERYYVEGVGYTAFYDTSISSVSFNPRIELKNIGDYAFYGCSKLSAIEIPSTVESIGYGAFYNCKGLTKLTLHEGLKTIDRWSFTLCHKLTHLEIPSTVEYIGEYAFNDCSDLSSLTLSNSLTSIADNAFSGCKALKEVVIPPSVETIGASAFEGGSELASIIMGHKVKTIGENAFNGCPAKTVSITAQTPPSAPNNTFSDYSGKLYLQGQAAVDAYYDAFTCWDRFSGYVMIEPTKMKYEGKDMYEAKPGDQFQLTARLMPEDVTLPQIFWRSTNPDIATVDCNGLVTIHADLNEVMSRSGEDVRSCKIIAESLYADGPVVEVTITDTSGIDSVVNDGPANGEFDPYAPVEVYNLHGMMVATSTDNLAPGFYIVRQGNLVKKIAVK